jgi:hypothetical protein
MKHYLLFLMKSNFQEGKFHLHNRLREKKKKGFLIKRKRFFSFFFLSYLIVLCCVCFVTQQFTNLPGTEQAAYKLKKKKIGFLKMLKKN